MGVKFIHTADVHLGSPLNGLGAEDTDLQTELREATYGAFRRLIDVALEADVEFVVIAGDLYDRESRSVRANQFAAEQFGRLEDAGISVYLVYGNHDPVDGGTTYIDLPDNVHEFPADTAESVIHVTEGEERACLCGQSYRRKAESRKLHAEYEPAAPGLPTVGLLHTGLDPDSNRYVPCDVRELCDREAFNYWALGHIHQARIHEREPVVAYPGIPQGRHVNETGVRGAYVVDLDDGSAEIEFVPTGQVVWHDAEVSIKANKEAPPETITDLIEQLEEYLWGLEPEVETPDPEVPLYENDWRPVGIMCRLILTGRGPAHKPLTNDEDSIKVIREKLRSGYDHQTPFVWTEDVRHRTGPPLPPLDELRADDPVFERFEQTVEELRSEDELRGCLVEERMGTVCMWDDGSEDERPTRLELTEGELDRMIDRAADLVIDEIRARRIE